MKALYLNGRLVASFGAWRVYAYIDAVPSPRFRRLREVFRPEKYGVEGLLTAGPPTYNQGEAMQYAVARNTAHGNKEQDHGTGKDNAVSS